MSFKELLNESSEYTSLIKDIENKIKDAKKLLKDPLENSEKLDGIFYDMEKISANLQDVLHKDMEE